MGFYFQKTSNLINLLLTVLEVSGGFSFLGNSGNELIIDLFLTFPDVKARLKKKKI